MKCGIMSCEDLADVIQHGVDTAKYYQQAERELEAERNGASSS